MFWRSEKALFVEMVIKLNVADNSVLFVMKCLREADDGDIAKQACETTDMNDVVSLTNIGESTLTSSDWAAVTFVSKHMKKLTRCISSSLT